MYVSHIPMKENPCGDLCMDNFSYLHNNAGKDSGQAISITIRKTSYYFERHIAQQYTNYF